MVPIAERALPVLSFRRGELVAPSTHRYAHGCIVTAEGDSVTVRSDLCAVDLMFWRREGDRILLSPDARLLHRRGMTPDPRGILSLITLGMVFPPFTLFREVGAFQPGTETTIDLRDLSFRSTSSVEWSPRIEAESRLPIDAQVETLLRTLDEAIEEVLTPAQPLVLFSGGVDSSLLAWRLREIGRSDALLVHFTFGEDSPDTIAARAMQRILGFPMEIVGHRRGTAVEILDAAPKIYRQPFADHSAVPTAELMRFAVDLAHRDTLILDGTGADGAFGLVRKARRYRLFDRTVPAPARATLGWPYRGLSLWRRSGPVERLARISYRLGTMSKLLASIAISPMLGIAVHAEPSAWASVNRELEDWVESVRPPDDPSVRIPLADLAVICAGVFAQKDFWFAAEAGVRISFPYLRRSMVDLAMRRACRWPGSDRPKNALKHALARIAPDSVVGRTKTGFVSPKYEIFTERGILERIDALAASDARLAEYVDAKVLRTIVDDLRSGRLYPPPIYNFLWSALVCESWLRGVDAAADDARRAIGAR